VSRFYVSVKKMKEDNSSYKRNQVRNSSLGIKLQNLAVGVTLPRKDGRREIVDYGQNWSSLRKRKCNPIIKFLGSNLG
jgi:hypothetical protein